MILLMGTILKPKLGSICYSSTSIRAEAPVYGKRSAEFRYMFLAASKLPIADELEALSSYSVSLVANRSNFILAPNFN